MYPEALEADEIGPEMLREGGALRTAFEQVFVVDKHWNQDEFEGSVAVLEDAVFALDLDNTDSFHDLAMEGLKSDAWASVGDG